MFGYDEGTPRERYDAILDHLDAMYDDLKTQIDVADARVYTLEGEKELFVNKRNELKQELLEVRTKLSEQTAATDRAYSQRAIAAVALAHTVLCYGGTAGVGLDSRENQPNAWRVVLYVDTPAGQLSWHIAPDDQAMLEGLPEYAGTWDGTYNSSNQDFYKSFKS